MTTTGLEVFDRSVQTTNVWLRELSEELHWEERRHVYLGLRAALHALRDRLPPEEAAHLAAQLPLLVKGIFYDGWKPGATPVKVRDRETFLQMIREPIADAKPNVNPEQVARAVFGLLNRHISEGEIEDVLRALPEELRGLWPQGVQT